MKNLLIATTLVIISSGITFIIMHDHFTGHFPWSTPHTAGIIQEKIHSNVLKEDRDIIIHLPPGYDTTATYPVLYMLDGGSEDYAMAEKFNVLSIAGYTPSTIVVGIPNMTAENRNLNLTPPFMNIDVEDSGSSLGGADQFLSFMDSELFPFIEKNYSASSVRLFTGNSRGGLCVMYSLLYKPAMFQARFCYSTPFWRQNYILVSKVADFLNSADTLHTFIYMNAGSNETENIKSGLERMTKTLQEKAPIGFTWYSGYTPSADHQNNLRISAAAGIGKWSEYLKHQRE